MKALFLLAAVLSISAFAQNEDPYYVKIEKLHQTALAQNNSPAAIGDLYDQVMKSSYPNPLPPTVVAAVRPFVIHAEIQYRNDKSAGVSEDQIVTAFNNLATALNLPRFDFIAKSYLEYRRDMDFHLNPTFMSYKRFKKGETTPSSQLSPLQAIYEFILQMNAKFYSPELTQTPEEWDAWYKE